MKSAILILLLAAAASAQVTVKFSPEPMAVPTAVLANARSMGRWTVEACNDGPAPVTLAAERFGLAAPTLPLIDTDDALLVLTSRAKRTVAGTIAHYGQIAAQAVALGLALSSRANASWATGLSIGSSVIPGIVTIAQGEMPSVAPLVSSVRYPVTIPPGGCMTDHRFSAKVPRPAPFTVTIK